MRIHFRIMAAVALVAFAVACEQPRGNEPAASKPAAPAEQAPAAAPASAEGTKVVAFELADPVTVGALQIDVQYKGPGRVVGDGDAAACQTLIDGALSSYNHITGQKMLKAAYVAVKGFTGPVRFAQCEYQGTPAPSDFEVTVKDASTPDLTQVKPAPAIKVVVE